jgi:UDP-N-acetylglucosamine 4,6-dehydratase
MCSSDESNLIIEFEDHYVITPTITFAARRGDYTSNSLKEKGKKVPKGFVYNSGSNEHFLSVEEIAKY